MSAFRFRLETVRKLREDDEKERAGKLAEALSEAGDANLIRERLAALEDAGRQRMKELDGDVARQRCVAVMMEHLAEHKDVAAQRCDEAKERVQERQAAFVDAITQRRAIDRLKEKQQKEWDTDTRRSEQKVTDENNSNRHGAADSGSVVAQQDFRTKTDDS